MELLCLFGLSACVSLRVYVSVWVWGGGVLLSRVEGFGMCGIESWSQASGALGLRAVSSSLIQGPQQLE